MRVVGVVRGQVRFPEHPEHQGTHGLVGGEDVFAGRASFRSPGEAMTWCRSVLDGNVTPRKVGAYGDLLAPRTAPNWTGAEVTFTCDGVEQHWQTAGRRVWRELNADGTLGATVRVDDPPPHIRRA